jgi:UDP-N-acetylglucosamine 2-epimerase (non-hydrolysing)
MKVAPLYHALKKESYVHPFIVHTGQHYDLNMSDAFFEDFDLPRPDIYLGVGSGTHAEQTGKVMIAYERVLDDRRPDVVVVVGDVNSTIACTLAASKIQYDSQEHSSTVSRRSLNGLRPLIAHVEAGLRSFDRTMPEEINRLVTDALSDLLFTPSEDADENLLNEGIPANKIKRVGNIMIDTLVANLDKARLRKTYDLFGMKGKEYAFITLHRPNNVDDKTSLSSIMESLFTLSHRIPVIFPVHPRTKKHLVTFGLWQKLEGARNLRLLDPLGYHDTICFVDSSRFVLTDSGGLQEETTFLGIPCLTLRPNTERPVTIKEGTNKLTSLQTLEQDFDYILNGYHSSGRIPELWDGHTAERIIEILAKCK